MSLFKLAVYGGIGYCIYQTFFAEMPASVETGGSRRSGSSRGGQRSQRSGEGSSGTKAMTGRGKGGKAKGRGAANKMMDDYDSEEDDESFKDVASPSQSEEEDEEYDDEDVSMEEEIN